MAAVGMEHLCEALAGPDGNLSRSNWNVRVRDLAITYPSLAAALAELLDEQDLPIPGPLRHARNNVRQETPSGRQE
jgi:hypothetical protein